MMTIPAPTAGWDAISPLSQMRPDAAIELINWIPNSADVISRAGYQPHTDTVLADPGRLVAYNADSPKLLLVANGNIYDVTTENTETNLTGAIADFANNQHIASAYKDRIIFCNGADAPVVYDGTAVTPLSATGPTLTELRGGVTYRGRVFYWEAPNGSNPQSIWYAGAGAFSGALTAFPLDEFTKGGYVVQVATWTVDGGNGPDDNLVVLMSTGEVLVYQGGDPGSAIDWSLIGNFQIGEPVGEIPITKVGGDNVILTRDGYLVLSAAIQEGRYSENSAFSFLINPAAQQAAESHGSKYGWHSIVHSGDSLFIVNIPISTSQSVQHVRNTATGAWCKWTGINAVSFAVLGDELFFAGKDGLVYQYGGPNDNGQFIDTRASQAFNYFGDPGVKKQVTTIEVQSTSRFPKFLQSTFNADYEDKSLPPLVDPPELLPAEWDEGEWDVDPWGVDARGANVARKNVTGSGYCLSHNLQSRSRAQRTRWYASHVYLKPMGIV